MRWNMSGGGEEVKGTSKGLNILQRYSDIFSDLGQTKKEIRILNLSKMSYSPGAFSLR